MAGVQGVCGKNPKDDPVSLLHYPLERQESSSMRTFNLVPWKYAYYCHTDFALKQVNKEDQIRNI